MEFLEFTNPHLEQLVAAFGPLCPDSQFVAPNVNILFLLYTNRCGSNFLAQVLASTGWFNEAGEFLNADTVLFHAQQQKLESVHAYFNFLTSLVARNGWMVVKVSIEHIAVLEKAGVLESVLDRSSFILLERQDRLAQAISRAIASQNFSWTTEHMKRVPDDALTYSRAQIYEEMCRVQKANGLLYHFLRGRSVVPIHFSYEALVKRPQSHVDDITARLRLPDLQLDMSRIRITRQANRINMMWRQRYLAGD